MTLKGIEDVRNNAVACFQLNFRYLKRDAEEKH
jgi:hypothetical protein